MVAIIHILNLSRYRLRLVKVEGEGKVDQAPPLGAILRSGQNQEFRLVLYLFEEPRHFLTYDLLNSDGATVGHLTVKVKLHAIVSAIHQELSCLPAVITVPGNPAPECRAATNLFVSDDLTIQDPPGFPPVVYTPAQPAAQSEAFRYLCFLTGASCEFAAASQAHDSVRPRVTAPFSNPSDKAVTKHVPVQSDLKVGGILGQRISPDSTLFKNITAAIRARFGHEWTPEHTFKGRVDVTISPRGCAAVFAQDPVIDYRGDFTIRAGNTIWKLTEVDFHGVDLTGQAVEQKWEVAEWAARPDGSCVLP